MNIREFKDKFGHYYSTCALDTMTGLWNGAPTYKSISNEIKEYYNSLIDDFDKLYRKFEFSCVDQYRENLGWRNYSNSKEWYHGIQPQHIAILNFIKNGDIDSLRYINQEQGYYIGFYKDCMLKIAIDNEQIECIDYLIRTKQINQDIDSYLYQVTPQFYDKLVERYHIKFMRKHKSSPDDTLEKKLYLFYSSLHWIDPEETYLNLKYSRMSWIDNTKPLNPIYMNPELLSHITEKYKINETYMCTIIKRLENSQRYIDYCFRNNKISELKCFFETEYSEKEWNQCTIFNLVKACIHYNCLEILDSIRINKIKEYDHNYKANLKFYKKKIKEILKNDAIKYNLINQKYITVFHNFENICV